ncbi:LPS export ABC transporter permease LptG [Gluconacetobacter tumulisoli]|uniref:LPS export ABC transporter permease LptG n=1 Tax=Gluconacetobacter tumulisoli TaxID=1286189 RepID=A0A7W4K537_9PROT|nr:LPS export ABC transporter permease LptG [Gluconacetobacter tumulisoli]MBB2200564.1 LPS export ABC transporter permease LptG [Gluconacetobacter tumulisoli]
MKRFDRYIQLVTLRVFLLVATGLVALFSLLEFVDQMAFVGQGHYRVGDAFEYTLLLVPARFMQVTPISMLLACLLGLGGLAKHSELTALQGIGLSEARIVGAALRLVVPIVAVLFLIGQFVVPPAQQLAQARRTAALSSVETASDGDALWAHSGNEEFLSVHSFGNGTTPEDIDIYAFGTDGGLRQAIHARNADIGADGTWLLHDVTRKDITSDLFHTDRLDTLPWHSFLTMQQIHFLTLPPESVPPVALWRYIRHLKRLHQPATRYEQELWARISIPFAMIGLIACAAPFVFGPPRSQNLGYRMAVGVAIAIVFSLGQEITSRLGVLFDLNPALTALTPAALLMISAAYLFIHTRG